MYSNYFFFIFVTGENFVVQKVFCSQARSFMAGWIIKLVVVFVCLWVNIMLQLHVKDVFD